MDHLAAIEAALAAMSPEDREPWRELPDALRAVIAEHAALIARLREAEADARRYRWLIDTFGDHLHGLPSIEAAFDDDIDDWRSATFFSLRTKDQFDAAIDAAMQPAATKEAP